MSKSVIYETSGRAREYCELALNLYDGCTHGCLYCYAAEVTHKDPAKFKEAGVPRVTPTDIELSAARLGDDKRPVLLCFTTDPYQPVEAERRLARQAIEILQQRGHPATVLTKAGRLPQRDFDIYRDGSSFGTTLTTMSDIKSRHWEPGAGLPQERISSLILAHDMGIPTWVSLEPVIDPFESISIIYACADFVDHFKVGKMNYYTEGMPHVDWNRFAQEAIQALDRHGKGYYIKKDLAAFIGNPEGLKYGRQLP